MPAGSSGGTAAAVAASFAALGWGSDTCGSIRIPAAYTSLFGLRATHGTFSSDGIIPLSHSQDVGGPLARTVTDLAVGLDATFDDGRGRRFTDALRADALRGARLGVLTAYHGTEPDEREAADIVRAAVARMRALGADVVDITIPDLDSMVAGTSTIDHEFKFDLEDYLRATPGAQVTGLGDILERRLHHPALEATFRRRNQQTSRDTDAYRRALARRDTLHAAVLRALDDARVDALVYPVIRRAAAIIPEANRGSTCQLSASTGMPAMAVPAGFTADGQPIGLELLGRRMDDARLVGFAFAWEQAVQPRRPPSTTPPLAR
jgi:amidase